MGVVLLQCGCTESRNVWISTRNPSDIVRPKISLKSCLDSFAAAEIVDDYYSSALKRKSTVSKLVVC